MRFHAWLSDEGDAAGGHPPEGGIEVAYLPEEADAAGDLAPEDGGLRLAIGAGERDAGLGTGWSGHDPPLREAVAGPRKRVLIHVFEG
jgi:hypothetical protein